MRELISPEWATAFKKYREIIGLEVAFLVRAGNGLTPEHVWRLNVDWLKSVVQEVSEIMASA